MMLGQVADPSKGGLVPDALTEHCAASFGRPDDRHHDLDQRGLACTVGTEQPEDFAWMHPHLDPAQRMDLALVDLLYMMKINCVFAV